jgi:hypothetical protein
MNMIIQVHAKYGGENSSDSIKNPLTTSLIDKEQAYTNKLYICVSDYISSSVTSSDFGGRVGRSCRQVGPNH